jgi:hypothetical protein
MRVQGRARDGVVVPDEGVRLPERLEVTVRAQRTASDTRRMVGTRSHSVLDIVTGGLGLVLRPLTSDNDLLGELPEVWR